MTEHHIRSGSNTWSPPSEPMVPRLAAPAQRVSGRHGVGDPPVSTGDSATAGSNGSAPAAEALEPVSKLSPTGWSPTAWRFQNPDGEPS